MRKNIKYFVKRHNLCKCYILKVGVKMENLKYLRKQSHLTQEEIATKLKIKQRTYAAYENGENEPNIDFLKRLSNFYNVSIDYLVENNVDGKVVYSEEQRQIFKMVTQLNDINTLKAYSYVAGLLAGQG